MRAPCWAIAIVAVFLTWGASSASAQDGFGCYGFGYDYGALYQGLDSRVPYFAAHPPVYYSYPVPRTYGYSPFAYPPYVRTPEVVEIVEPTTVLNPFVPGSGSESNEEKINRSARSVQQPQPLIVLNPFVPQKEALASNDR